MWIRILAVVLIITMLAAPVSAASVSAKGTDRDYSGVIGVIIDIIRDFWKRWHDEITDPTFPTEPEETTAPTEPEITEPIETEPEETTAPTEPEVTEPTQPEEETPAYELNLVEGHANTENGQLLRGVTYTLAELIADEEEPQVAPYALRTSTLETGISTLSLDSTDSGISTAADTDTNISTETVVTISDTPLEITFDDDGNAIIPDGTYVIYSSANSSGSYLLGTTTQSNPWGVESLSGTTTKEDAYVFTFTRQTDGTYAIQTAEKLYMDIPADNRSDLVEDANYIRLTAHANGDNNVVLTDVDFNLSMNALDADNRSDHYFGGWITGSPFQLFAATVTEETVTTELIYFPVTMFNYDDATINAITDSMDEDTSDREGIYFTGDSSKTNTETDLSVYVDGQYYIQSFPASQNDVDSWLYYNASGTNSQYICATSDSADATVWTLTNKGNNQITLSYEDEGTTYYLTFGNGTSNRTTTETTLTLVNYPGNTADNNTGVQIQLGSYYLNQWGGNTKTVYGGYNVADRSGNVMVLYRVGDDDTDSEAVVNTTKIVDTYEPYNLWAYRSSGNSAQNMFYTGLVKDKLNANNEIVFTVNDPGIFTYDASAPTVTNDGTKDIYQYVGLPFVKNDKGYYTFDSDAHGTYFADTDSDGVSDPGNGTSDNYFDLYFDYQNTQGWSGMSSQFGDKSSNLWAPYNTNENDTGKSAIDYHFGMRADIPFSMTSNGRIKSTDDTSEPITFTFAGDDDVWIFIDGQLVIDLGGIHNRIGATIDFANNTITYFRPESNGKDLDIGSFNDSENYPLNEDGTITVKLYNDAESEGALGQTRADFAADEQHEMSIFYLERGEGTSNCKIEFNLPMRDTVLITKDATKSWSEAQDEADGDEGDGTVELTAKEQAAVDKLNFGFTLYKKVAKTSEDTEAAVEYELIPVANTNFYVQDKDGNILDIQSTDSYGKFYLKNGRTAKFMTDIPAEGVTYYVVEDALPEGFLTPDYQYAGVATNGFDYSGVALEKDEDGNYVEVEKSGHVSNAADLGEHELPLGDDVECKSYEITVYGSVEAIDSIEFICTNYLDEELPNPTALAYEDIIVIDYGLPVQIDPLENDLFRGDEIEIVAWGGEDLTLNEVLNSLGTAVPDGEAGGTSWTGNVDGSEADFNFGKVIFNDVDYTEIESVDDNSNATYTYTRDTFDYKLTEQLTEVEVISYIVKVSSTIKNETTDVETTAYRYALAKVYIVPATIMYYEENFSDLVTFTGSGWDATFTTSNAANVSAYQEPGVVGTIYDSTYGSDAAYLSDNGDSNGTYRFGDTTNGAIRFTYTFTGTGTSIFARTSASTGYMQVKIYKGTDTSGTYENIYYRDTYWKDDNGVDENGDTLYNIPVFTDEDLDYGTYTVVCTVAKKGTPTEGNTAGSGNEFYLDGIRIMQPLNQDSDAKMVEKALSAYATDGEANLDVVTLRYKLITDAEEGVVTWDGENYVVMTDINGEIVTAEVYTSIGPKEEVYLAPGQTVTFSLKYWQPEGLKLYMGMKAPFGSAQVNIGHKSYTLNNAPDCYYDVAANYASLVTETEQATTDEGYYLFTDASGNVIIEKYDEETDSFLYYYENGNQANVTLDDLTELMTEYYVVTYTFTASDSIVSLTNIKVVGSYEFTIIPSIDINGDETQE